MTDDPTHALLRARAWSKAQEEHPPADMVWLGVLAMACSAVVSCVLLRAVWVLFT